MLQPESITTTEAGKESYGYTVSDTREYPNLDRNDTAYIPKAVEKNGVSLTLAGIDWQAMGNGTFTATASYSGRATGSKVTGYTSKAIYSGEVSKETLDSCTYKVIYEGAPIPAPYLQYGLTAGSVLALLIILAVLWNRRKNAKIYALLDGKFKIVRRVRISYIDPIVDLTSAAVQSRVSEYIITIDRWATKRLNNQRRGFCAATAWCVNAIFLLLFILSQSIEANNVPILENAKHSFYHYFYAIRKSGFTTQVS